MDKDTKESLDYIKSKLNDLKDKWIQTNRKHDTGIGKTLEDLLNIDENNLKTSDLKNLEVKAQRLYTSSKLTLFTKSPSYPKGANAYIRENFGVDDEGTDNKIIHTSFFGHKINNYKGKYGFKLTINRNKRRIDFNVYDTKNNPIKTKEPIYWTFDELEHIFQEKIRAIAYINAISKKENNKEFFKYSKCTILLHPCFEKFLWGIEKGIIQFDIRIGVYKSGKSKGKSHDHGSGFRISSKDFSSLFEIVEEIIIN